MPQPVSRANVDYAKKILAERVGNGYVYGGNWSATDASVGTDCSGLVVDICDAVRNGRGMAWSRHGMSTESWRPIEVGQTGTRFGTVCVAHPRDFPEDAAVKIAIHHGPGGGANSHTWCEVDGVRGESNGSDGCVTGSQARSVYDTSYANDWHYIPGPIEGSGAAVPHDVPRRDRYALAIIAEGRRRGVSPRGIQIALATALVESDLVMYANAKVPESLRLPHDAVGSDGMSVGLFQQQIVHGAGGWWWSDAATCMDSTLSAGLFFERLERLDYDNGFRTPGSFAQAIQQSAFPDRYDLRFADAVTLYNRLNTPFFPSSLEELLMPDFRVPSLSIYRTPGEPDVPLADMIRALDAHGPHEPFVEALARAGDPDALARVARTAAGKGADTGARAVGQARAVLADIEAANPSILADYLKG